MSADSRTLARAVRTHALRMVHRSRSSHVGTCLSMADLLAVLYADVLRVDPARPEWPGRDRLVVSKGHGAAAVYAVLAARGFLPVAELETYSTDGARLTGHVSHKVPGVELSTGSLGHGLSVGAGMALFAARAGLAYRTVVLVSDGELDEGSNWEPILFAPAHRLANLVLAVDYNKIQSFGRVEDVLPLEPLADKFRAFGWEVRAVDGHDHDALRAAFAPAGGSAPVVVLAHTVKGRGVSFMEDRLAWHYKSPNDAELEAALTEVTGAA